MNRLPRLAGPTTAALSIVLAGLAVCADARPAAAQSAHSIYTRGLAKERQLRDAASDATLGELRSTVRTYELVVRRFPKSGYSDNALWQAANLAILAFERFNEPADRKTATRLLTHLREQYPSSSLASRAAQLLRQLEMNRLAPEAAPIGRQSERVTTDRASGSPTVLE